jgi:hypothetical protein
LRIDEKVLTTSIEQLANTEEYQEGQSVGSLGEVFIRFVVSLPLRSLLAVLTFS